MNQIDFCEDIMPDILQLPQKKFRGLKTYLRYPGGKSRHVSGIKEHFPLDFSEYRETMIGGGSVFLYVKKTYPDKKFWINDIYRNLYLFWIACQNNNDELIDMLLKIKSDTTKETSGVFFEHAKRTIDSKSDIERAAYFYYLNKCSFSGLTESGTCSQQAWVQNFSQSSIESLHDLKFLLQGVVITNTDYNDLFAAHGENVFIYADPPYDIGKQNSLYGRNGATHKNFDHDLFAENSKKCKHKLLVSYNDSAAVRNRLCFMHTENIRLRYTMRITKKGEGKKNEILASNYLR